MAAAILISMGHTSKTGERPVNHRPPGSRSGKVVYPEANQSLLKNIGGQESRYEKENKFSSHHY